MKPIAKIWNVISTILVVLFVVLAILLAGVRVVGITPYVVLSGSMEPTYHVGSIIYDKKVDPADLKVGDPITFVLGEDLTVATHRIVEISEDGEHFYTKGDANDAVDGSPVYAPNIVGVPVFTIPYLGYFSNWISNPPGTYIGICGILIVVILMFLPDMLKKAEEADKKEEEEKKENS